MPFRNSHVLRGKRVEGTEVGMWTMTGVARNGRDENRGKRKERRENRKERNRGEGVTRPSWIG